MAKIKGWKKKVLKNGRTLYISEKYALGIQYSPRGMATIPYAVDIIDRNNHSKIISLKHLRTKKLANDYAIKFMRYHSNG